MASERERYERLMALFQEVRALPEAERAARLEEGCGSDLALRSRLEAMLRSSETGAGEDAFGEESIAGVRGALERVMDEDPASWLPERIAGYRIVRRVGVGGMGVVYEAVQESPRRRVALKLLHPMSLTDERLKRFRRESEVLGRLQHPGVARIIEAGQFDAGQGPQPFFAMEYVDGLDLRSHCEQHALDLREKLSLVRRVASAVNYAHAQGVIHRDLKPENILVDEHGQPKILDFGIARSEGTSAATTLHTREGQLIGTLAYMAPEQLSGDPGQVTGRVDVHALGVVAFELLTGSLPFPVSEVPTAALVDRRLRAEAPRVSTRMHELRGDVDTILGKALELEPGRRYADCEEFARDIERYLNHEPILATPPSRATRLMKFARRNRPWIVGWGAAAAILAVALVTVRFLQASLSEQEVLASRSRQAAREAIRTRAEQRREALMAVQRALEAGDPWGAERALPLNSDPSWPARLQAHEVPRILHAMPVDDSWRFLDDDHLIRLDEERREFIVVSVRDQEERVLFEGAGFERFGSICSGGFGCAWRADELYILDLENEVVLGSFPGAVHGDVSADGRTWCIVEADGTLRVYVDGEPLPWTTNLGRGVKKNGDPITGYAHVANEGDWIAALRLVTEEEPHERRCVAIFVPDGRQLDVHFPGEPDLDARIYPFSDGDFVLMRDVPMTASVYRGRLSRDGYELAATNLAVRRTSVRRFTDDGSLVFPSHRNGNRGYSVPYDGWTGEVVRLSHLQLEDGRLDYGPSTPSQWAEVSFSGRRFLARGLTRAPFVARLDRRAGKAEYDPRAWTLPGAGTRPSAVAALEEGPLVAVLDAASGEISVHDHLLEERVARFEVEFELDDRARLEFARAESGALQLALVSSDVRRTFELSEGAFVRTADRPADREPAPAAWPDGLQFGSDWRAESGARSPDGSWFAVGTDSGRIAIVETVSGVALLEYRAHAGAVRALAWTSDGERLVSASDDGLVRVWDARPVPEQERDLDAWNAALEAARNARTGPGPRAVLAREVIALRVRAGLEEAR